MAEETDPPCDAATDVCDAATDVCDAATDVCDAATDVWDVAVVGGGAAGLCAAIFSARCGGRTVLLETRPVPGAKIRISGGGRCNVLPSRVEVANYHTGGSANRLRNVLLSWPLADVTAFFQEDLDVPLYVEEGTGKVFPVSNRSRDVVQALLRECARCGVTILGSSRVSDLRRRSEGEGWSLRLADRVVHTRTVILATGGLSMPLTGSDGQGLAIARRLGHGCVELHPALVPLRSEQAAWIALAGIALPVELEARREGTTLERRTGDFLFTHRGFSGPVVMDLSRHVTRSDGAAVELVARWGNVPTDEWQVRLAQAGAQTIVSIAAARLPRRLAQLLVTRARVAGDRRSSELRRDERTRVLQQLGACPLPIHGHEGYAKAEVTAGGIPLEEVRTKTLESTRAPGLFLCGEILDVVAHIGGYNFLWAWASGRRAGEAAARSARSRDPAAD